MKLHKISGFCFSVLPPWELKEVETLKSLIQISCKFLLLDKSICLVVKEPHKLSLGFDFGIQIADKKSKLLCTYIESVKFEQLIELISENEEFIDGTMRFLIFNNQYEFKKENVDQYLNVLFAPELVNYKSIFVDHDANSFYLYNFSRDEILELLANAGKEYTEKYGQYI
ncbi:MAG: hypothetical protein HYV28_20500 [Ignavibacteriales bacterium]|nr:hypothetical protein [Ignavibacteriales bacterium]